MTGRRILVTGGFGFIGSHLVRRLLSEGHDVLVVDNFYSGRRENLFDLVGDPRLELLRHDVTFPLYVEVDEIDHLACPASPAFEVYGDPAVHPQHESYWGNVNPIGPRACYDEGKRCAETLFFDYRRQHDLPIKVARVFNTYGPGMRPDDGRVVSNFIVAALTAQPLTIFGDGSQTRSFCYVDDLVDGLIRLMNTPHDVTGPINLGNPVEFTMLELASQILQKVGGPSELEFHPLPQDDPLQRKPDIGQALEVLRWEPRTDLDEGLDRTIDYFRATLDLH
jgi:UDP-glucuronate decarboxylase